MNKELESWYIHTEKVLKLGELLRDPVMQEALNIVKLHIPTDVSAKSGQDALIAQTIRMSMLDGMRAAVNLLDHLANPTPPIPEPEAIEDYTPEWVDKVMNAMS